MSEDRSHRPGLALARLAAVMLVMLVGVASAGGLPLPSARAQVSTGATLTVLRSSASVVRSDGTAISPATSGLTLGAGDRVATLAAASALVTFFDGTEVELGADTTIVIQSVARQGGQTTISVESVLGTTVHRVVSLTDTGSSYRVESGGSVALVRGTVFAHHVDPGGDITVAVGEGEVEFPTPGRPIRRGSKRTLTSRGDVVDERFDPATSLFNAVTQPVSSGNPTGTDNPGLGTGSFSVPQQQSAQQATDERDQRSSVPGSTPGRTVLIAAAPSGSVRLEVASTDGFAVGDLIRIGAGPSAEVGTIVGFGSIVLSQPLVGSFGVGTPVERIGSGTTTATTTPTATPTATGTASPTATPTGTLAVIGVTVVPSPTSTATPTPSPTVTPTSTATSTPSPTVTPTSTATFTSTPTATSTATPSPAASPTATSTSTPTPTPTAIPFGSIMGVVRDALTGLPLADARLSIDGTALSVVSLADGSFSLANVPLGPHTVRSEKAGYVTDSQSITVVAGPNTPLTIALTPIRPAGDITIVLTWAAQPRDLDSHLSGPSTGGGRFHLFFENRTAPPVPYADLDLDDVNGSGPETITIRRDPSSGQFVAGEYHYWVHNFSTTPQFDVSLARVVVNQDTVQLADFRVAAASGNPSLDIWYVVTLTLDSPGNVTLATVQKLQAGTETTIP